MPPARAYGRRRSKLSRHDAQIRGVTAHPLTLWAPALRLGAPPDDLLRLVPDDTPSVERPTTMISRTAADAHEPVPPRRRYSIQVEPLGNAGESVAGRRW
jgi:hypothetical protein